MVNIPGANDVLAAFFATDPEAEREPEAEPSFIGGLPEDRIIVTVEHEIAAPTRTRSRCRSR